MKVTILYFASLREALGIDRETVELPAQVQTAAQLRQWLMGRGEIWAAQFAPGRAVRVAIARQMAQPQAAITEGAEVAFFPPVTGG